MLFLKKKNKNKNCTKQTEIKYQDIIIVTYFSIKIHKTTNNVILINSNKYKINKIFFEEKFLFLKTILYNKYITKLGKKIDIKPQKKEKKYILNIKNYTFFLYIYIIKI